jgi:hypothetical protein
MHLWYLRRFTYLSHLLLDLSNKIWWKARIINLLIMQSSPLLLTSRLSQDIFRSSLWPRNFKLYFLLRVHVKFHSHAMLTREIFDLLMTKESWACDYVQLIYGFIGDPAIKLWAFLAGNLVRFPLTPQCGHRADPNVMAKSRYPCQESNFCRPVCSESFYCHRQRRILHCYITETIHISDSLSATLVHDQPIIQMSHVKPAPLTH